MSTASISKLENFGIVTVYREMPLRGVLKCTGGIEEIGRSRTEQTFSHIVNPWQSSWMSQLARLVLSLTNRKFTQGIDNRIGGWETWDSKSELVSD